MDELSEFMETAKCVSDDDEDVGRSPRGITSPENRKETRDKERFGNLAQYASLGGGKYTPTAETIKDLPPNAYTIGITIEGQLIFNSQKLVTDTLLRLPDSKSDAVILEVEKFWTLKEKFKKYGFAHKRGFLLWGPPGSGKTSTLAITTEGMVKSGGIVLIAESPVALAMALKMFRTVEPERPLVVIWEDIDTIIYNFGESAVLSILDGESQVENVVYIATTNYPEKLDGRIINRPSRFDRIVKIGMPNNEARRVFLESKLGPDLVVEGIDLVKETEGMSIAHMKELIISVFCQGNAAADTLERLKGMKRRQTSDSDGSRIGIV